MPKKKFINSAINPYHVTNRCINKEWFVNDMDYVWHCMCDELYLAAAFYKLKVHAFVLMSNHYHLLVSTPEANLSPAMAYFGRQVSDRLLKPSHRINQMWARRFKRCEIGTYHYFMNAYKYLYQNPLRAGLCGRVESYKYSTLPGLLGEERAFIPVVEDTLLFNDIGGTIAWLNKPVFKAYEEAMSNALNRLKFTLPKLKNKVDHPLETVLI